MPTITTKVRCLMHGHDRGWRGKTLDGQQQLECERCGDVDYHD
jgi:hypothetical protein